MSGFTLVPAVKAGLITLLGANAADRFTVEGYQRQSHAAEDLVTPHVTVYWRETAFQKERSGWMQGPFRAALTFSVELKIAAPAKVDLRVLNDPGATAQALMSALAAMDSAGANADTVFDATAGAVWAILIDPRNAFLGGSTALMPLLDPQDPTSFPPVLPIADRWVASARKESPVPRGEYVILTGAMDWTCSGNEIVSGDVGKPIATGIDITLTETADPTGAPLDPAAQGARSS